MTPKNAPVFFLMSINITLYTWASICLYKQVCSCIMIKETCLLHKSVKFRLILEKKTISSCLGTKIRRVIPNRGSANHHMGFREKP